MENNIFYPGDIVEVLDNIDCETKTIATVKYIEKDAEINGIYYLYLIANESILNDKIDVNTGIQYWKIIESNSPYLNLISHAVE